MRRFAFSAVVVCLVAMMAGVLSVPACAVTYNFYTLDDGHQSVAYGITNTSTAVIRNEGVCFDSVGGCYTEFVDGHETVSSDTVPALTYVNGSACVVDGVDGLCNGAYDAFLSPKYPNELFAGIAGSEVLLLHGYGVSLSDVFLNGLGDVLYSSGTTDESYEAITTTPEPSTLALLGSGMLGAAATLRRRVFAR